MLRSSWPGQGCGAPVPAVFFAAGRAHDRGVHASANVLAEDPAARVVAFAARLRRRHVRRAAEAAAVRVLLALAVPAIAGAWLLPAQRAAIAAALAALALAAAVAAALAARRVADAALFDGDGTGALVAVGDELATWLEQRRARAPDTPMVGWLAREVDVRLPRLPAGALAGVGRRRLGRWGRLVPLVLALLLAWLIAEWLAPPWPGGLAGGGGAALPAGGGGGDGEGQGGGGTAPEPAPQPEPAPDQDRTPPPAAEPPPTVPPPPERDAPPPVEPEAPAPLLDLPEQQRFVVPEFVGDGPTRRVRMHAAELAQQGRAPRRTETAPQDGGDAPAAPPPTADEFERAAEAAQRARHVPEEERPIVRRFFELLREAAK